MDDKSYLGVFFWLILYGIGWLGFTAYKEHIYIQNLQGTISDCSYYIQDANGTIDSLNDQIRSANSEAWSDYDTMGYALRDLYTGFKSNSDCTIPDYNDVKVLPL